MNQIELHERVDGILRNVPGRVGREDVSALICANEDVRQYFFAQANDLWLDWLWENGFLSVLRGPLKIA